MTNWAQYSPWKDNVWSWLSMPLISSIFSLTTWIVSEPLTSKKNGFLSEFFTSICIFSGENTARRRTDLFVIPHPESVFSFSSCLPTIKETKLRKTVSKRNRKNYLNCLPEKIKRCLSTGIFSSASIFFLTSSTVSEAWTFKEIVLSALILTFMSILACLKEMLPDCNN